MLYLRQFERALDEDKTMLTLTEPLTDEDRHFMKEIFLPPSHELILDLSSFETEKIQGYAIVLKQIDGRSNFIFKMIIVCLKEVLRFGAYARYNVVS